MLLENTQDTRVKISTGRLKNRPPITAFDLAINSKYWDIVTLMLVKNRYNTEHGVNDTIGIDIDQVLVSDY
jgi:hypothetical protein